MFRKGPFVFSFWVFPKVVNKLTLFHNVEMMRYVFKRRQRHVAVLQNSNCFVSSVFSVYTNINTAFSFWVLSTREAKNFPLGVLSYIDNLIPFRVFSKVVNRPFTFRVFFTYINTPFLVFVVFYKRNNTFSFWAFSTCINHPFPFWEFSTLICLWFQVFYTYTNHPFWGCWCFQRITSTFFILCVLCFQRITCTFFILCVLYVCEPTISVFCAFFSFFMFSVSLLYTHIKTALSLGVFYERNNKFSFFGVFYV